MVRFRSLLLPLQIKDLSTIKLLNKNSMKVEDVKITTALHKTKGNMESVKMKKVMSEPVQLKKIHIGETLHVKKVHMPESLHCANKIQIQGDSIVLKASSPEPNDGRYIVPQNLLSIYFSIVSLCSFLM